jgi:hypothetical protein
MAGWQLWRRLGGESALTAAASVRCGATRRVGVRMLAGVIARCILSPHISFPGSFLAPVDSTSATA